jgi:hypothetical protein
VKEIKLSGDDVTVVDDEDYDWLMKYSWHSVKHDKELKRNRLRRRIEARTTYRVDLPDGRYSFCPVSMHRLIMNAKPGDVVDHINGNPLDNRKENLRLVTNQQNSWNSRGAKTFNGKPTSSRFKGVYKKICKYRGEPRYEYWVAKIGYNGREYTVGHFNDEVEAACMYDLAAQNYFGDYARLNFDGAAYDKWYNSTVTPAQPGSPGVA